LFFKIKDRFPCHLSVLENDPELKNKELLVKILKFKLEVNEIGIDDFGLMFLKSQ
jgi:hypothetical protein